MLSWWPASFFPAPRDGVWSSLGSAPLQLTTINPAINKLTTLATCVCMMCALTSYSHTIDFLPRRQSVAVNMRLQAPHSLEERGTLRLKESGFAEASQTTL